MKTGDELARLLASVTGLVNQELLLQVEYLVAENRILRAHAPARLRLSQLPNAPLWVRSGNDSGERVWRKSHKRDDSWLVAEAGGAEV